MTQIGLLWELQELEQEKIKKESDLLTLASILHYREKLKEVKLFEKSLQQKEEELAAEKKAQRLKELDVANKAAVLADLDHKLYDGKIGNIKELEGMEKKIQTLKEEKKLLEDEIIQHMENIENMESENSSQQQLFAKENELLQKLKAKARKEKQGAQNELAALTERIDGLSAEIDEKLLKKYREWSKRFNGERCISQVQDGFCGICNVSLPSSFTARLLTGELVYCENCSSILVLKEE